MKFIDELTKYKEILQEFKKFIQLVFKIDPDKFIKDAPNTSIIPHLIIFLEKTYNICFLDALFYTYANTISEALPYNDLVKKAIKVCFYKLEHKQELDFTPF